MSDDYPFRNTIKLPCGAIGILDTDGCYGYICQDCLTIYGSISNPCYQKYNMWDKLKGKTDE